MSDPRGFTALGAGPIDDTGKQWIEVLPTGNEQKNGPYLTTVDRDDLEVYAQSIRDRGGRVPVDYDHEGDNGGSTRAAGWFTGQAKIDDLPDGTSMLCAEVQWTPTAAQEIRDGHYRFTSPVYSFKQRDSKTGLMTKAKELVASTLTNRPFYKQLAALATDVTDDQLAALAAADDPMEVFTVLAASNQPYGDVTYADPGYQADKKKRYPLDTEEHIRAAWSYINKASNGAKYSSENLAQIKSKIRAAMKRIGADVTASEGAEMELKAVAAALGLADDATEEQITTALATAKTAGTELETTKKELDALKASADDETELDKLRARLAEIEKERRDEQVETALATAVTERRIEPAAKEALAEQFADNVDGLTKVLAAMPARPSVARGGGGHGKDNGATADEVNVDDRLVGGVPIPVEQRGAAVAALADKKLAEAGKTKPTRDELMAALAAAEKEIPEAA